MNQFRINQILNVLLFPYLDPYLQREDFLYEKYCAYQAFVEPGLNNISMTEERLQRNEDYKAACRNLVEYLTQKNHGRIKSYDDIELLCDLYYPVKELSVCIEQIQKKKEQCGIKMPKEENIAVFYLHQLFKIAGSMITYRDGVAAIRTWSNLNSGLKNDIFPVNYVFDKVEIWNILNRFMVPDILIAAFAVECGYNESALFAQKPQISLADKLLIKVFQSGLAENHLHFNAGYDYETLWISRVNLAAEPVNEESCLPYVPVMLFRLFAAQFLKTDPEKRKSFSFWVKEYYGAPGHRSMQFLYAGIPCEAAESKRELIEIWRQIAEPLWKEAANREQFQMDFLLYKEYSWYIELMTSSEFILLYQCCRYVKEHSLDTAFARIFLQYLRVKNHYFSNIQQDRLILGLAYFQKYFGQAKIKARKVLNQEDFMLDIFRSQGKITNLRKLEIRIAPAVRKVLPDCFRFERCRDDIKYDLSQQLFSVLYVFRKYMLESVCGVMETKRLLAKEEKRVIQENASYLELLQSDAVRLEQGTPIKVPTLGIVYHFIKTENLDDISGYACWKRIDDNLAGGSYHKLFLRQKLMNIAVVIEELRGSIPRLNEYIVGIDAASDERAMEPWMLSSAYNRMRSRQTTMPVFTGNIHTGNLKNVKKIYSEIQNIGFTYHVGEEFRHVLSGLRHIDEVVEEFHYKPGDRLGHAIALGLNISQWVMDNEMVPLPIMEYMENLLWLWGKNVIDGVSLPIQLEILEERILKCAEKIYGTHGTGLTVHMLYQVYKMKFLQEHKKQMKFLCGNDDSVYSGSTPHCRYGIQEAFVAPETWTENRLLSTNYCPVFVKRGKQIELVPVHENEIALYQLLQEHLMEKIAKKGIYIETNPTSNLTIGEISEFKEHPIFKMNPIGKTNTARHHVLVTVNSDDPIIFNTNVENELAYIYYALERAGYDKEDILDWIKRVRENGMDASFIKKEKDVTTMLWEISEILDRLKKV